MSDKKVLVAYFSCSGVTAKLQRHWQRRLMRIFLKLNRKYLIQKLILTGMIKTAEVRLK